MEHYLGQKIKKLREERGWSQKDLSQVMHILYHQMF